MQKKPVNTWLTYSEKEEWSKWLNMLLDGMGDVYSDPEYVNLYADKNRTANCFVYVSDGRIFLYPFLMQKIPISDDYFDITTPYGFGGPLFNTSDNSFLTDAYSCFNGWAKKKKIVAELIKFNPLWQNHKDLGPAFGGNIIPMCKVVLVRMDIDEEIRWKDDYTAANRKNINKAARNNITVRFGRDNKSWEAFQRLYFETLAANQAQQFYFFDSQYFMGIKNHLKENYILCTASLENKIIAGMILLYGVNHCFCHLLGSDRSYLNLGVNNFIYHKCIAWCRENRIKEMLIGGGRTNADEDSLLKFKKNFSKNTEDFFVGERILNSKAYTELCEDAKVSECQGHLFKYRA